MSKKKNVTKGYSPSTKSLPTEPLLYGKKHYILMGIGFLLIVLGMILMLGGAMPDPDTWDESLIYSHRRITIAPLMIVLGLVVEIYAIFWKPKVDE